MTIRKGYMLVLEVGDTTVTTQGIDFYYKEYIENVINKWALGDKLSDTELDHIAELRENHHLGSYENHTWYYIKEDIRPC